MALTPAARMYIEDLADKMFVDGDVAEAAATARTFLTEEGFAALCDSLDLCTTHLTDTDDCEVCAA
jgi:hypothetical protein